MANAKRKARKTAAKPKARKPASKGGFGKLLKPSPALAAIVGSKPISRGQVTRKVWAYIRKHDLQDAKDRRMVHGKLALKPILKGKVSMFKMTALVSKHLH